MGCFSSQCSSRTLSIFFRALLAALVAKKRPSQIKPAPKPIKPPSKPDANICAADRCRLPGQLVSKPTHAPSTAGGKAFSNDSRKNGVRGLPFKNASRPERTPSSPEFRTLRPYSTSDLDHSDKSMFSHFRSKDNH